VSDLAITVRCWEDLAALPIDVAEHILDVFVARRGVDADSGETMKGIGGPLHKLHADLSGGRSIRAVTWYDRGRDACWLLAAGDHSVYERVENLASTGSHLPTAEDVANFESDAPVRLMERVLRTARSALHAALATPNTEVPVTDSPPPKAYFRVDGNRLWVRIVVFEQGRRQVSDRQIAAIWASVFGTATIAMDYPLDGGVWDSLYLVGPCPSIDDWPPPKQFDLD
jgi:hypothetical protein